MFFEPSLPRGRFFIAKKAPAGPCLAGLRELKERRK
jgi:hypothetical protein